MKTENYEVEKSKVFADSERAAAERREEGCGVKSLLERRQWFFSSSQLT